MPPHSTSAPTTIGDPVRVRFRKWGDLPHWEYDARLIGHDEHGTWVGAPAGTSVSRPGASFVAPSAFVSVVPDDRAYVATFYAVHPEPPGDSIELYVDITTVPVWDGGASGAVVTMVDLDLDVVRGRSGRVWVDDEDEFAEHRVRFGYPDEVVTLATASCEQVRAEVRAGAAPFGVEVGRAWLTRLVSAAAS